jgi:divalent metal cation (Fe/Co/Zn/Cd) transporter
MAWLLGLTFLHVFGEGGLALWEAIRTGSLALLAFGIESVIEGGAAFLAVRHLRHLADEEEDHARSDFLLARWIGVSFLLLALYIAGRGAYELAVGSRAERSPLGLFLTIFATFGMPLVGYFKWKTSRRLGSKGLAAEAKESIACSIDSGLTMLAMIGGLLGRRGGSIRPCRSSWSPGSSARAWLTSAGASTPTSDEVAVRGVRGTISARIPRPRRGVFVVKE